MSKPYSPEQLPAGLNAMTLVCAAISCAAASTAVLRYMTPVQKPVVAAVEPILDEPAPPVETVLNPEPANQQTPQNGSVGAQDKTQLPPPVKTQELASALKPTPPVTVIPTPQSPTAVAANRAVVKVIAQPTPQVVKPEPVAKNKAEDVSTTEVQERLERADRSIEGSRQERVAEEKPQNFRPLDIAQRQSPTGKSNSFSSVSEPSSGYAGPSIVAVSSDRVWVRISETKTAVMLVGDSLADVGKVVAINNGAVKFENGATRNVGDLIK